MRVAVMRLAISDDAVGGVAVDVNVFGGGLGVEQSVLEIRQCRFWSPRSGSCCYRSWRRAICPWSYGCVGFGLSPSVWELGAVTVGFGAIAVGHEVELSVLGVEPLVGCSSSSVLQQFVGVAAVRRCCGWP